MTESMVEHLKTQLDGRIVPLTGNSEAGPPGREALDKAYRQKVRDLTTIVRALLVDAGQRARADDTIVPAPRTAAYPEVPIPVPTTSLEVPSAWPWRWAVTTLLLSFFLMHVLEIAAFVAAALWVGGVRLP